MSESDNLIREFDQTVTDQLLDAYVNKKQIDNLKRVHIFHEPFTHCYINDLVTDTKFVDELEKEIKAKLKYQKKNNDLYKFHQTSDLAKIKSKKLSQFRDKVLYGSLLEFLKKITGIELSSTKIDVTSSKYEYSDYLLCHDDDIHDDKNKFGRRIAFIYYLVPEDWSQDGTDGGNLDLFKTNESLEPVEVFKSLTPKRNTLAFFEVSDRSFHQVAEVLTKTKCRLSVHGWFHGNINFRPARSIEISPEPLPLNKIESDLFFEWITEKYLNPANQSDIQRKFSSSSEIKLDSVFNKEKYEKIAQELQSESIKWKKRGPADRRLYEEADLGELPETLKEFITVLASDCMGLTLSNMTGLALHPSVPKTTDDDNDDDTDDEGDEEEDEENSGEELDGDEQDSEDECIQDNEIQTEVGNKRKIEENVDGNLPCTSSSLSQTEMENKKIKTSHDEHEALSNKFQETTTPSVAHIENPNLKPKFHIEIRRWKQGFYTLIRDDDNAIKTKALDLMMFFNTQSWSLECGGNVSYIARDEDTELLTVSPEENCISLIYRDEETLKFTKYVNDNLNSSNTNGCFYEICVVYYEYE